MRAQLSKVQAASDFATTAIQRDAPLPSQDCRLHNGPRSQLGCQTVSLLRPGQQTGTAPPASIMARKAAYSAHRIRTVWLANM